MIWALGHPSFEQLSRYADGELEGTRRDRVASHLSGCDRCRHTIRFIRELGEAARSLPAPEPPADAIPRVLARRAAGERVILPTSDPIPLEGERRRTLPTIAATVALLLAGTLLVSVPRLSADRSRLGFEPARPRAGQTIDVEYESGSLLRSEDTLVLRGRLRFANGTQRFVEVARLARGSDGVYHGSFTLPDSTVYAVFAVEDTAGARVDSNTRRLWELVVHDADGRPLYAALRERTKDLMYRNWELAFRAARSTVRRYPDRAWGWHTLYSFEKALVDGAARDSLNRAHLERLHRLDAIWRDAGPGTDEAAYLALYAFVLGDAEIHQFWRDRLLRQAPGHPLSIQFRLFDSDLVTGAPDALATAERLWNVADRPHLELAVAGFQAALRVPDATAAYRWADRVIAAAPEQVHTVSDALARSVVSDDRSVAWLDDRIQDMLTGNLVQRELYETRARYRQRLAEKAAPLHARLAGQLLAVGRESEALDLLVRAAEAGWDPHVLRTAARALAEHGRPGQAADFLARVAVDPAARPEDVRAATTHGRAWVGDAGWRAALSRADEALIAYVDRQAVHRRLPSDATLLDSTGATVALRDALDGEVALVAFWSPQSAPAIAMLPWLEQTARRLRRLGIRTVAVYPGEASPEARMHAQQRTPSAATFYDPRREVASVFEQWGTPEYFVVDRDGIIRFAHTTLDAAVRQAAVLAAPHGGPRLVAP